MKIHLKFWSLKLSERDPILAPRRKARVSVLIVAGLLFGAVLFLAGCADRPVENAFQGEFSSEKNNKVINEYCKACHIHKNFEPESHMASVSKSYKRTYFRRANECRACHYIEKNWVTNNYHRKTRSPMQANRGKYRDFEREGLRELKKNRATKD